MNMSSTTTPKSVFSNTITAPIIGMAQGAYDAHVAMMSERVRILYGGQRVVDDGFAQVRVAAAASEIDAAWLQLECPMSHRSGQFLPFFVGFHSSLAARTIEAGVRPWVR